VEVGSLTNKEKEEFLCKLIPEFKELLEAEEMLQNSGEILNKEKLAALHGKANLLLSNMLAKFADMSKMIPQKDSQGISSIGGLFSIYPSQGSYKYIYSLPIVSPSPISPITFLYYQQEIFDVILLKHADDFTSLVHSNEIFFTSSKPLITIKEACEADKLFVNKKELRGLLPKDNRRIFDLIPKGNGENNKFNSSRKELSLIEVIGVYGCTVDDLFHEAAHGNLTIYFRPHNFKVGVLISVKSAALQFALGNKKLIIEDLEYIYPGLKNVKNEEEALNLIVKPTKALTDFSSFSLDPYKDINYIPPYSFYRNDGNYRVFYALPYSGPRFSDNELRW